MTNGAALPKWSATAKNRSTAILAVGPTGTLPVVNGAVSVFDVAVLCHSVLDNDRRVGHSSGMANSNRKRHHLAVRLHPRGRDQAGDIDVPGLCSRKSGGAKYFADRNFGTQWNYHGPIAGLDLNLPLKIVGEGDIDVPAGRFRALHFRGEKNDGLLTVADFWFVRGVGSIKETVTQRSPSGDLLSRNTIELLKPPAPHQTQPIAEKKKLEASVSTSSDGDPLNVISEDALQIVARWRGHGLRKNARVRAAWIAQDTGIAPVDFKVDEATAIAPIGNASGKFTLARPPDGWATGKYRIEFYVDDELTETVELTIAPSPPRSRSAIDFMNPDRQLPASNF